jgi:hypothetical protein
LPTSRAGEGGAGLCTSMGILAFLDDFPTCDSDFDSAGSAGIIRRFHIGE